MEAMPRVFVASSKEALRLAQAVQQNLDEVAQVTVWNQDAFRVGHINIDELDRNLQNSQFGAFVFAPDDTIFVRGQRKKAVRDNVILELGMFLGRLGRQRSFIILPRDAQLRLPTDLLGLIVTTYDGERNDLQAALGPACTEIADAIRREHKGATPELNQLVGAALETVCRAMSVPIGPDEASLRAFIFRHEGIELVCKNFWDPNPSDEEVDKTRFEISKANAERITVVRCFLKQSTQRGKVETEGSRVEPLPPDARGIGGKVKPSLKYVLAAPIHRADGSVWGVVDFDASNDLGMSLLSTKFSCTVILRLAQHLGDMLRI